MNADEVPQHAAKAFAGRTKALYATDRQGKYGIVPSSGWDAEQIVLDQALGELAREAADAHARAVQGLCSPLEYHMWRARMDVATLAQSTGFFQWQVRRHLRSEPFARLPEKNKRRYADALGCSVSELQTLPDVP